MLDFSLEDLLAQKHGLELRTYKRSKDCPIDCCFDSPSIKVSRGGYLSFSRLQSDHRGVWINIPIRTLLGHRPPAITYFQVRRLKFVDPRIRKKYQKHLAKSCHLHDIFVRMDDLHRRTVYPLSSKLAKEYKQLDKEIEKHMENAEK